MALSRKLPNNGPIARALCADDVDHDEALADDLRPKPAEQKTLAELYREEAAAHERAAEAWQRYADAERTYALVAPWLIAIAGGCFIVAFLM